MGVVASTQHQAAEPELLYRRLHRWLPFSWFVAHGLATAGVLVLVIGGIVGQRCPPLVGLNGKTGPFAYDDGDLSEALSLAFAGPATLAVGAGLFAAAGPAHSRWPGLARTPHELTTEGAMLAAEDVAEPLRRGTNVP